MDSKYDFDDEILSDEEAEIVLSVLAKVIQNEDEEKCFVNTKRAAQVIAAYRILEYVMKDSNVTVSYELHEPLNSMGSVSITGKSIHVTNTKCFLGALELADNMEVYPKTDGTVQMDFCFHRLTSKEVSYEN